MRGKPAFQTSNLQRSELAFEEWWQATFLTNNLYRKEIAFEERGQARLPDL